MRRQDGGRRLPLLAPLLERGERVESVRPLAAAAVAHARREEEPDRIVDGLLPDGLHDAVVIHQRRPGRDVRVGPSLIDQELPAARGERLEVGIVRAERRVIQLVNAIVVAGKIECLRIPVRILQQDVLEDVVADVERLAAASHRRPLRLAARLEAGKDHFAGLRVLETRVQLAHGFDLRRREARLICRVRKDPALTTLDHLRIEMAAQDVFDQPILQPVERVARLERRAMDGGVLRRRDDAVRRFVRRLPLHHEAERFVAAVVRGRAREDGVEVGGVALRFLERHAAAARAAGEVRQLRPDAVETGDRLLAVDGGEMLRAIAPIDDLFRMARGPLRSSAGMTRIRGCGGVAALERVFQRAVLDRSGERTIAHLLELAVPARHRHPHLGLDVGIGRGFQRELHAAVRGQSVRGGHDGRGGDRRVRNFQRRGHARAVLRGSECRKKDENDRAT